MPVVSCWPERGFRRPYPFFVDIEHSSQLECWSWYRLLLQQCYSASDGLADVVSRDGVIFRHVELLYQVNNGALGPLLTARVIAKRVAEVVLY